MPRLWKAWVSARIQYNPMVGAEAKGCANLMRGLMAEEFKKAEKK